MGRGSKMMAQTILENVLYVWRFFVCQSLWFLSVVSPPFPPRLTTMIQCMFQMNHEGAGSQVPRTAEKSARALKGDRDCPISEGVRWLGALGIVCGPVALQPCQSISRTFVVGAPTKFKDKCGIWCARFGQLCRLSRVTYFVHVSFLCG